jgi:hypothetical protein
MRCGSRMPGSWMTMILALALDAGLARAELVDAAANDLDRAADSVDPPVADRRFGHLEGYLAARHRLDQQVDIAAAAKQAAAQRLGQGL